MAKDDGKLTIGEKTTLTFLVSALAGSGSFVTYKFSEWNKESGKTNAIIDRVMYKASGDDGILSIEEKAKLIKDLGFEYVVQEGQRLYLEAREEKVEVLLDKREIGVVSRESLENYLSGGLKAESE